MRAIAIALLAVKSSLFLSLSTISYCFPLQFFLALTGQNHRPAMAHRPLAASNQPRGQAGSGKSHGS